jgi:hypothetical protein
MQLPLSAPRPFTGKPKAIVSLFDLTGEAVKPWAAAGYLCFTFDMQSDGQNKNANIVQIGGMADTWADTLTEIFNAYNVKLLYGFPPCTDLATSGARHFEAKAKANPDYRKEAMDLVYLVRDIGEKYGVPYMIENPVSVISSQWRKPTFSPSDFGGYLPEDDISPHPDIIPARDAYAKKTCLWTGGGFVMPEAKPVDPIQYTGKGGLHFNPQTWLLGGKSLRTKNLRSATPRGFAKAVYAANA